MRLGRFITHVSCWVPQSRLAAWVREDLTGRQVTWVHHLSLLHIFWRPAKHLIFGPSFHLEKERTITGNLYWLRPYEHFRRQVDSAWQTKASWSEWVFFFFFCFFLVLDHIEIVQEHPKTCIHSHISIFSPHVEICWDSGHLDFLVRREVTAHIFLLVFVKQSSKDFLNISQSSHIFPTSCS